MRDNPYGLTTDTQNLSYMSNKISSIAELVNIMGNAKAGGQYVTLYGESDVRLNKFPTDGTQRIHIKDGFTPRNKFHVTYHFSADYEKAMAKALGVDNYTAHDSNRTHLVKNVVMQYISTGTVCMIYMPEAYHFEGVVLDGKPISAEDEAYMSHYKAKPSKSTLPYRTLNVKSVTKMVIGHVTYDIDIAPAIGTQVA